MSPNLLIWRNSNDGCGMRYVESVRAGETSSLLVAFGLQGAQLGCYPRALHYPAFLHFVF